MIPGLFSDFLVTETLIWMGIKKYYVVFLKYKEYI